MTRIRTLLLLSSMAGPLVGTVIAVTFLGATSRVTVDLGDTTILAQLTTSDASALPAGSRVVDVLASFDFPPERRVIVGVNGQAAGLDDAVVDGARIDLVPPISGGQNTERTV